MEKMEFYFFLNLLPDTLIKLRKEMVNMSKRQPPEYWVSYDHKQPSVQAW